MRQCGSVEANTRLTIPEEKRSHHAATGSGDHRIDTAPCHGWVIAGGRHAPNNFINDRITRASLPQVGGAEAHGWQTSYATNNKAARRIAN